MNKALYLVLLIVLVFVASNGVECAWWKVFVPSRQIKRGADPGYSSGGIALAVPVRKLRRYSASSDNTLMVPSQFVFGKRKQPAIINPSDKYYYKTATPVYALAIYENYGRTRRRNAGHGEESVPTPATIAVPEAK
jgi:hypothetical protein